MNLLEALRAMGDGVHDDLSVAHEAAREIERLRECDKEYWNVVERCMTLEKERDEARAEYNETLQMAANQAVTIKEQINEIERLRQCCTQRGARMQILRKWIDRHPQWMPWTNWDSFVAERPEARDWFDEDGVPVDAAREGE